MESGLIVIDAEFPAYGGADVVMAFHQCSCRHPSPQTEGIKTGIVDFILVKPMLREMAYEMRMRGGECHTCGIHKLLLIPFTDSIHFYKVWRMIHYP